MSHAGWEPFIEPWPCSVLWQQQVASRLHQPRLKVEVRAKQRLDFNVTSVLLGKQQLHFASQVTSFNIMVLNWFFGFQILLSFRKVPAVWI